MSKLALLAALAVPLAAAKPAAACTDSFPFLDPLAYGLGIGLVGAYGYGIGYYALHDLDGTPKSTNYLGSELILHGSLGAAWTSAAIGAARAGDTGSLMIEGSLAAIHLTLGTNGLRGLVGHTDEVHLNDTVTTWTVGALTGINALVWTSGMSERHGRTYGLTEIAVNAPFVAGFAYLAKERLDSGRTGPALGYAALTAVSTTYVAHGVKTALFPFETPKLDLGTEIKPTMVSDGSSMGAGLGTSGTW